MIYLAVRGRNGTIHGAARVDHYGRVYDVETWCGRDGTTMAVVDGTETDRVALWDGDGLMCPRCGGVVDLPRRIDYRWPLECKSCRRGLRHPDAV